MSLRVIERFSKYCSDPLYRFKVMSLIGAYKHMDDTTYLKKFYMRAFDKKLNLENPKTFNEIIQWMKINDHNPLYTTLVDKYSVKKYVADKIGEEYVIPTIGVWNHAKDINYNQLPDQFVLKCTHDSGGIIICKNKKNLDINKTNLKLEKHLKRDFYYYSREWPYKDVKRRIIAEPYLEDTLTGELRDYKFFCFNGDVKLLFVASGRQNKEIGTRFDFFDEKYNHLDLINGYPNADTIPDKPQSFDRMLEIARELSRGFKQVRIDLYEVDGKTYFGEFTFYHFSGLVPFKPEVWDKKMGSWINLK